MEIHEYDEKMSERVKEGLRFFLRIGYEYEDVMADVDGETVDDYFKAHSNAMNTHHPLKVFLEILKRTGSVIAGGSILHFLLHGQRYNYKVHDLDIYTNSVQGAKELVDFFSKHYNIAESSENITPAYDDSFLRKNHIHSRLFLALDGERRHQRCPVESKKCVDIMIVEKGIPLQSVVTNFDLTFCQVFFDGEKAFATHPQDVEKKEGSLNDEYLKSYMNGNRFILNRIEKYKRKGFTIHINTKKEYCDKVITISKRSRKKTVSSMEEWLVKKNA